MYNVMLVEDEMLVRMGLKNSINWDRYNMQIIADASNGKEALDLFNCNRIDLVITDLKMPKVSGMELISEIRKVDKDVKIVILSCLEEFELAKKALSYDVSDYIIKHTMTVEEMEEILMKVKKKLDLCNRSTHSLTNDNANYEVIKEKLIKEFMFYNLHSEKEMESFFKELNIIINPSMLVVSVVEIEHYDKLKVRQHDEKGLMIKNGIINLINESMKKDSIGEVISDDNRFIILFSNHNSLNAEEFWNLVFSNLNYTKKVIEDFYNIKVSIGLSTLNKGISALYKMYQEANSAIENKFYYGSGIFSYTGESNHEEIFMNKINILFSFIDILKIQDKKFIDLYKVKVSELMKKHILTPENIKSEFCLFINWILASVYLEKEDVNKLYSRYLAFIEENVDLNEIIESIRMMFDEIKICLQKNKIMSGEIAKSIEYIEENYYKEISLQSVAEKICISPNYFSSLFKKELGINFTDYLNDFRIEKAKALLLETYLKSYEIAEKVGFKETTYFSKQFKKIVGVSPNEFRHQWLKEWTEELGNEIN